MSRKPRRERQQEGDRQLEVEGFFLRAVHFTSSSSLLIEFCHIAVKLSKAASLPGGDRFGAVSAKEVLQYVICFFSPSAADVW